MEINFKEYLGEEEIKEIIISEIKAKVRDFLLKDETLDSTVFYGNNNLYYATYNIIKEEFEDKKQIIKEKVEDFIKELGNRKNDFWITSSPLFEKSRDEAILNCKEILNKVVTKKAEQYELPSEAFKELVCDRIYTILCSKETS